MLAVKWQYWVTAPQEKRATGAFWRREELGLYAPEIHLGTGGIELVSPQSS